MVLRFLVCCIALFISTQIFAQTKGQKRFISLASKAHAKKQYAKSNKYLKRAFNFKRTKRIPATVLYLYAVNLQKLGNHKNAVYYLSQMIKKQYLKKHLKVMKAYRDDEIDGDEIPKLLKATYFYIAQSHYAIFNKTKEKSYAEKAKKYFKICDESDFNDRCADFLENIEEKLNYAEKIKEEFEFFLYAGRLMLNDRIGIKDNSSGASASILSSADGVCYGAGLRLQNYFKGWQVSGCLYSGFAALKGEISGTQYKQLGVPVAGLYSEVGRYWRTDDQSTRLGLSVPLFYRSGLYSQPTGFTLEDAQKLSFGAALTMGFQLPLIELEIKLASMQESNLAFTNLVLNF